MAEQVYKAVVQRVVINGRHGPYAVAYDEEIGSVTFALKSPVWTESDPPENGVYVMLSKVRKKRSGWRAEEARFMQPSDEKKPATEKKEGAKR